MIGVVGVDIANNPAATKEARKLEIDGVVLNDKSLQQVAGAWHKLDGFSRQVLVLSYMEKMSCEEIAFVYPGKNG